MPVNDAESSQSSQPTNIIKVLCDAGPGVFQNSSSPGNLIRMRLLQNVLEMRADMNHP